MESVLHLRVNTGPTKHTHTDLSCICDPPLLQVPGTLAAQPPSWALGLLCPSQHQASHSCREPRTHSSLLLCSFSSHVCVMSPRRNSPRAPEGGFRLVCVRSPLSAPGTLRVLEITCLLLFLSPWPLAPEHSLRKDRPTRLSLVWNGESTHQQQTSRRALRRHREDRPPCRDAPCPCPHQRPACCLLLSFTPASISKVTYFLKGWESFRIQYLPERFAS